MQSFVSAAAKVVSLSTLQVSKFADQFSIRLISQLISGISKVLQKVHKYFNGAAISTFALSKLSLLIVNLDLNLNDSESVMLSLRSYLRYCHRLPNVFTYYCCTLLDYVSTLQHVFLDIKFILFPPAAIAAAYVPYSTTFIALFTSIYASVYLQRYDFSITVLNWF